MNVVDVVGYVGQGEPVHVKEDQRRQDDASVGSGVVDVVGKPDGYSVEIVSAIHVFGLAERQQRDEKKYEMTMLRIPPLQGLALQAFGADVAGRRSRKNDAAADAEEPLVAAAAAVAVADVVEFPTADGTDLASVAVVFPVDVEYPIAAAVESSLAEPVVAVKARAVSEFLVHVPAAAGFRVVDVIVAVWPALAVLSLVFPSRDSQLLLVPVPTSLLPVGRDVDVDNRVDAWPVVVVVAVAGTVAATAAPYASA